MRSMDGAQARIPDPLRPMTKGIPVTAQRPVRIAASIWSGVTVTGRRLRAPQIRRLAMPLGDSRSLSAVLDDQQVLQVVLVLPLYV